HAATFDATNFPSGVYYYKLETGGFVQTKKMILMK
ncbi:MAG: T9SS type A sorting domain-containing protein, partial [Ignavibacteriales bacterium]|nr:T9SS type A sorting domain-containing protein [Ignavibacteriales bacterium]